MAVETTRHPAVRWAVVGATLPRAVARMVADVLTPHPAAALMAAAGSTPHLQEAAVVTRHPVEAATATPRHAVEAGAAEATVPAVAAVAAAMAEEDDDKLTHYRGGGRHLNSTGHRPCLPSTSSPDNQ